MSDLDSQVPYWDAAAATKTFTHPLHLPWLDGISRHAAILDYGCGYGRIMKELEQHGFDHLTGVDASPAMISRARRLHPHHALCRPGRTTGLALSGRRLRRRSALRRADLHSRR
ncbi:class I SAM-dependent methyltransferase [Streptomyces sp. NPDC048417]|uniref:class I SAM-dependent methyltransferase n=1 Tax=Streptomyces sp. NPDC048417 TaxID=3155387 RepID=UPI00343D38E4